MKPVLTPKQKRFCEEYIIDLNGTQAAIRAGYSNKAAREQAYEHLTKTHIQNYINDLIQRRSEKTGIIAERVLRELALIAFFNPRKLYDESGNLLSVPDMDGGTAQNVSEVIIESTGGGDNLVIRKRYKLNSKIQALEMLAKHTGLFERDNQQKQPKEMPLTAKERQLRIRELKKQLI